MPLEPKAQLVDPQGPLDVDGVNATGITTATGGFVGQVQGSATGLAATTYNLQAGIITATRFIGDVTGTASSLAQGANITVGIMTATFVGDLVGNATGLSTTTSNLNLGIVTSTGFRGNFTGLSSGLSGTPNIQTGITTATKFIGNSSGTVVDLADDTNINVGIITATKFEGNTTGSVTDLADDTNINVGIITASKFIGNANGSVTGLADDTNINVATFTATEFKGNSPGTAADLKSGTNLTVGTFTGTKFIGNTPGSATKLADDVNVAASTFTGTKFVGNTPGTVTGIADDTNLNLGTLTASQFIGNSPGNATGISAAQNIAGGTITATTFHGDGSNLTGAGSTAFIRQSVTAQSGTTTINLNDGNIIYLTHSNDTTIAFSNVKTADDVTIIRTLTGNTITWPDAITWNGGSAPTLIQNNYSLAGQVFNLVTADGGTTWYGYEEVNNNNPQPYTMFTAGYNASGNLGQNDLVNRSSPIQIPGTTWVAASNQLGPISTAPQVQKKSDGTLWSWGYNSKGQLGQNSRTYYSSPVQIPGTTWAIGSTNEQVLWTKTDGTLWAWGRNDNYGQLGLNDRAHRSSPVQVGTDTTWPTSNATGMKITTSKQYSGSAAIKTDGTLWVWGQNGQGQLGQGSIAYFSSPVQVPGTTWKHVTFGWSSMLATKTDGSLWAWGMNYGGQLGQNSRTLYSSPRQVGSDTTWASVTSGLRGTTFATKTNGTLWSWGYNEFGQIVGVAHDNRRSSPVQIPGTNWNTSVFGGGGGDKGTVSWTKTDGTLWTWGQNQWGQLGLNQGSAQAPALSSPVQVPGTDWSRVVCQGIHSVWLKAV